MKRRFEKKINIFFSFIIIVVLLPLIVTVICQRMQLESLISVGELNRSGNAKEVLREETETECADPEAEINNARIIGIVAKEISANYSEEAIKAQCVIARTNLYDAKKSKTEEPKALSIQQMQELWGENFSKIYQNLENCVTATGNEVITWNGTYIYAAYHAVSGGITRTMSELYEDSGMPYLTETACHDDTMAEVYLAVLYWEKNKFLELCKEKFPDAALEDTEQIFVAERDSADYVLTVQMGEGTYSGEEFRSGLGLNSACFTIAEIDGQIRIVTKGLGHGFGLSQYTANLMAMEGKSYRDILKYFYPGTEISEVYKDNQEK